MHQQMNAIISKRKQDFSPNWPEKLVPCTDERWQDLRQWLLLSTTVPPPSEKFKTTVHYVSTNTISISWKTQVHRELWLNDLFWYYTLFTQTIIIFSANFYTDNNISEHLLYYVSCWFTQDVNTRCE